MTRKTHIASIIGIVVGNCATVPDITVSYYFPKAETQLERHGAMRFHGMEFAAEWMSHREIKLSQRCDNEFDGSMVRGASMPKISGHRCVVVENLTLGNTKLPNPMPFSGVMM